MLHHVREQRAQHQRQPDHFVASPRARKRPDASRPWAATVICMTIPSRSGTPANAAAARPVLAPATLPCSPCLPA